MKLQGIASAFVLSFVSQSPRTSPLLSSSNNNQASYQQQLLSQQTSSPTSALSTLRSCPSILRMTSTTENENAVLDEFRSTELNVMLRWSSLVYAIATLRDIVRENDKTVNEKGTVEFEDTELVYTQHVDTEPPYQGTYLKYPIDASGIYKFMSKNNKWLVGDDGKLAFNPDGDKELTLPTMKQLTFVDDDDFDADIIELDDEFVGLGLKTELVFSIIVNKTEKRITVVFRGSSNPKDFIVDARVLKTCPEEIKEFAGKKTKVHRGFSKYLFGATAEATETSKASKFQQILYIVKQLYNTPKYSDYKFFITGHSLGGGLTQLLAFVLAGSKEADFIPKPIYGVSYASPTVGNKEFYKEYQRFEQEGKVRHIRVSNEGDVVPTVPSGGYKQTGINLHAKKDGKMQVKYEDSKKSLLSQMNVAFVDKHGLSSYSDRIFKEENVDILSMDIEELYAKFANIQS